MGLKPREVKALLYKEFNLMLTGYFRQQEHEWNRTRHLMQYIQVFGGMGASQVTRVQDIWPLQLDKEFEKRMITSLLMAKQLLKEFE